VKLIKHLGKNDDGSVQLAEVRHEHVKQWKRQQNYDDDDVHYVDSIHL